MKRIISLFFLFFLILFSTNSFAESKYDPTEFAMHHVMDSHEWHLVGNVVLPLPCIVIHHGLNIFSSSKLYELNEGENYKGLYLNEHGKIAAIDEGFLLDISITKSVATLLIDAALLLLIFLSVAGAYKKKPAEAPKGLQSLMEPLILFVRDEIVKSNLGKKTDRYFPFILTLFFFILLGNLLGLIPFISSPNLTGNITVTMSLALMTFIVTNLHANKAYWKHIIWPPGIPFLVKIILVPIEILGIFIKPFALMIRLFANITAGHIIIISLVGLIFIFGKAGESLGGGLGASAVAVPFTIFMSFLELLVAFLQAYIFAMLSTVFISLAQEEHHEPAAEH